jgi:hypothetical protein
MIWTLFVFFLLSAFFICCENGNGLEPGPAVKDSLQLSYSKFQGSKKYVISKYDTITLDMGDTLSLYVSTTGKLIGIWGDHNFEIQNKGDDEHYGIAIKACVASVGAFVENANSTGLVASFIVKIPSLIYEYIVVENLSSTVDVGNETLKETIQKDLEKSYIPAYSTDYRLKCDTVNGGDLLLFQYSSKSTSNDTIRGTFTTSNIKKMADIVMSYNNSTYSFTSERAANYTYGYVLKQDLTKEFRAKYPLENIREVVINSLTMRYCKKECKQELKIQ